MFRKVGIILVFVIMMSLLTAGAAAAQGSTAVIDAGNSDRVHLRAGASKETASKGLYFTGTQVACDGTSGGEWTRVTIGTEKGYIFSAYLKTGDAADAVQSRQPGGIVVAPKGTVNFRKGPSADTERIGLLHDRDVVNVLGETAGGWYCVEADGKTGYVKNTYLKLSDIPGSDVSRGNTWQKAYAAAIRDGKNAGYTYCLIDVDGNDIPEMVVNTGFEAGGCQIYTYSDGQAHALQTNRLYFTYLPGQNLLCNSEGNMGYYYDIISRIQEGKWETVASGEYDTTNGECDEERGRYICRNYIWNQKPVTREAYMAAFDAVYDEASAVEATGYVGYDAMMKILGE